MIHFLSFPLAAAATSFVDDPVNNLGSNLLKVTIGLAALVFIIMLQAHHNHDPGKDSNQRPLIYYMRSQKWEFDISSREIMCVLKCCTKQRLRRQQAFLFNTVVYVGKLVSSTVC